jgi:long-chain acyl-CoA synthetase
MGKYKETSMGAIFQNQVMKYSDRACVACKTGVVYADVSWNRMNEMVHGIGWYLMSAGIKRGDKVAVFSENRHEWWVCDMAILSIGAVTVPIYATNSAEEARYILHNSESKAVFCGTRDLADKVLQIRKKLGKLKNIIMLDEPEGERPHVITFAEALKRGEGYGKKDQLEQRLKAVRLQDVATLIYTSGTTGNPKGVMLTHDNFVSNMNQILDGIQGYISDQDVFLSLLPLSHSLERTAGYYLPMTVGAKVAFAEGLQTIQQNFLEVRPTVIISVPRLYEKIHAGILVRVADSPPVKKKILRWALKMAAGNLPYICTQRERKGLFAAKYRLAEGLVFSKLKSGLGMDRLKFAVSGGGPLSVSDAEFFLGMGIVVLEGFGLTETTPVTNFNRPWLIKAGTVGPAVKDTVIRIGDDGEILIKGPQIMKGYYKNPAATKEAFTRDGYLKTGDIGVVDEDGYLTITGRIKDIIVTSGGKSISPQNIENSLKTSRYIEQVAVVGDRRKYLTALVIPIFEELEKWARRGGIAFAKREDLLRSGAIRKLIDEEIKKYTKQFARVEQIRDFRLLDAEWTQATGELTPTLKVKRKIISEKYAEEIEGMYPASGQD